MKRFAILALLGVMACGDSTAPTVAPAPDGLYLLQTIGGQKLPQQGWNYGSVEFQVFGSGYPNPGAHYDIAQNGNTVEVGTWTQSGSTITLTDSNGGKHTATFKNGRVTMGELTFSR